MDTAMMSKMKTLIISLNVFLISHDKVTINNVENVPVMYYLVGLID